MDLKQLSDIQSEYKFLSGKIEEMRKEFIDIKGATDEYNRIIHENEKVVSITSVLTIRKEEIQKDIESLSGYIKSVEEESERNTQAIIDIGERESKIRDDNSEIDRKNLEIIQSLEKIKEKSDELLKEYERNDQKISILISKRIEHEKNTKDIKQEKDSLKKEVLELQEYRQSIEKDKSDIDKRNEELIGREEEYKRLVLWFDNEKKCILSDIEKVNIKCS